MSDDVRLVVFDMEGTLTADPTVWELMHLKTGTWESHGRPYWEQFKAGVFGYDEFARKDVAMWRGASHELLEQAVDEVPLMTGCAELLAFLGERGVRAAIVSNGLECLARRLARAFSMACVEANCVALSDGHLTGDIDIRVPFEEKGDAFLRIAEEMDVPPSQAMAVGDGAADVQMFRLAGRSVAFRPENDRVANAAGHVVTEPDLSQLIPLFGQRKT